MSVFREKFPIEVEGLFKQQGAVSTIQSIKQLDTPCICFIRSPTKLCYNSKFVIRLYPYVFVQQIALLFPVNTSINSCDLLS